MSFSDIASRVFIDGVAATDPSRSTGLIATTLKTIYENSDAGTELLAWLNADNSRVFSFTTTPGNAYAHLNMGEVFIDPNFPEIFLSKSGTAIKPSFEAVLTHEIGHAITNNRDTDSFTNLDGANITHINPWLAQLGLPQQASYNSGLLQSSNLLVADKDYTHGHAIVNGIVDRGGVYDNTSQGGIAFNTSNLDLTANGVTGSTLIVGSAGNNNYKGTSSNDWIYSGGGTDIVDGGGGNDVVVADKGNVTVKFGSGSGHDVVETGIGNGAYNLSLQGLNPGDISIIAGGEDLYGGFAYYDGQVAFEFVTFKVNSTGETITFTDNNRTVGVNASPTYDEAGTDYAAQHSPISSITFANGTVWDASTLWTHINEKYQNADVTWDLMFRGDYSVDTFDRQIEHNDSQYSTHINTTYFQPDPISSSSASSSRSVSGFDTFAHLLGSESRGDSLDMFNSSQDSSLISQSNIFASNLHRPSTLAMA